MSAEYKRGYGKGYSTGCRRSDAANAAERERADLAANRAERAEQRQGIGHCEGCAHWDRGDSMSYDSGTPSRCAWGICTAKRGAGGVWGTWAEVYGQAGSGQSAKIATTPRFGCVIFRRREAPAAQAGDGYEVLTVSAGSPKPPSFAIEDNQ